MALIPCPECNKHEISLVEGTICPSCGYKISAKYIFNEEQKNWGQLKWFFLGVVVFFVSTFLGVVFSLANSYLAIILILVFVLYSLYSINKHELLGLINKRIFIGLFSLMGVSLLFINISEIIK